MVYLNTSIAGRVPIPTEPKLVPDTSQTLSNFYHYFSFFFSFGTFYFQQIDLNSKWLRFMNFRPIKFIFFSQQDFVNFWKVKYYSSSRMWVDGELGVREWEFESRKGRWGEGRGGGRWRILMLLFVVQWSGASHLHQLRTRVRRLSRKKLEPHTHYMSIQASPSGVILPGSKLQQVISRP